jgi:hypothetical protein
MNQVFLVPILAWVAVLIGTGFDLGRGPRPITIALVADRFARWICLVPLGLMGLWGFLGHVFFPAESAEAIGWANSPFQYEVGMANLGIGLAGVLGAFITAPPYRLALAVVAIGFLGGAGIGHLIQISETGNAAVGNAGPILYTDFLTPIALLVALAVQRLFGGRRTPAPAP